MQNCRSSVGLSVQLCCNAGHGDDLCAASGARCSITQYFDLPVQQLTAGCCMRCFLQRPWFDRAAVGAGSGATAGGTGSRIPITYTTQLQQPLSARPLLLARSLCLLRAMQAMQAMQGRAHAPQVRIRSTGIRRSLVVRYGRCTCSCFGTHTLTLLCAPGAQAHGPDSSQWNTSTSQAGVCGASP